MGAIRYKMTLAIADEKSIFCYRSIKDLALFERALSAYLSQNTSIYVSLVWELKLYQDF